MSYFVVRNKSGEELNVPINYFVKLKNHNLFFLKKERINNDLLSKIKIGDRLIYVGPGESDQYNKTVSNYLKLVINKDYKIENIVKAIKEELIGMHM